MSRKYISIVVAFVAAAGVAVCGPSVALAQDSGTPPPPSDGTSSMPPPLPPTGGSFEPPRMPPPPSGSGEFHPGANENRFSPPEMLGRPVEGGASGSNEQYQKEYQKQYMGEVQRQTEQKTRGMQERYTPPQGKGEFRPQGQPFMESGRDNAQGRPFMNGSSSEGRSFSSDEFGGMRGDFDEEAQGKMMEEREKMMQQEQLKQMKRGMVSGLEQGLRQIKRMTDKLTKKGITIPADAQGLLTELSTALEKIKAATEFTEDVEAAMEVIQDKGQDLGDVGQKLGMLEQMSQMTKQVEKEFTRIDKELAKAKKTKIANQYPDIIAKIEGELNALKSRWKSVKSEVLSGDADPEDVRETTEGVFEEIGEVRQSLGLLRQLSSISKMIKSAEKEVARFDKEIARQKKAGRDVVRLTELLGEARGKLGEIIALSKQSGFDPEDLFDLMQELEKIRDNALLELDRITGKAQLNSQGASVIQALKWRRLGF